MQYSGYSDRSPLKEFFELQPNVLCEDQVSRFRDCSTVLLATTHPTEPVLTSVANANSGLRSDLELMAPESVLPGVESLNEGILKSVSSL